MHTSHSLFKVFCVSENLATVSSSISPQNISPKHMNLGNVTGTVIQTAETIWHSVSAIDINLDLLKPIKEHSPGIITHRRIWTPKRPLLGLVLIRTQKLNRPAAR